MPTIDVTPAFVQGANAVSSFAKGFVPQENINRQQAQQDRIAAEELRRRDEALALRRQEIDRNNAQDQAASQAMADLMSPTPPTFENKRAQMAPSLAALHPRDAEAVMRLAEEHDARDHVANELERFVQNGGASDVTPDGKSTPNPEMQNSVNDIAARLQAGTVTARDAQREIDTIKGQIIAQRTQATIHKATIEKLQGQMTEAYGKGLPIDAAAELFHLVEINGVDQTKDRQWEHDWNLAVQGLAEIPGYDGHPIRVPANEVQTAQQHEMEIRARMVQDKSEIEMLRRALLESQGRKADAEASAAPVNAQAKLIDAETKRTHEAKSGGSGNALRPRTTSYADARKNAVEELKAEGGTVTPEAIRARANEILKGGGESGDPLDALTPEQKKAIQDASTDEEADALARKFLGGGK